MDKNSIYYVCRHYLMGDGKCLRESHDLREINSWKDEFKDAHQYNELYISNDREEVYFEFDGRKI